MDSILDQSRNHKIINDVWLIMFYINEVYTFIGLALDYNWKQRIKKANEDRMRVYNFFQLLERMYVLKKK